MTRLRIGHTRLTHEHLFQRADPKICDACDQELTVEHIIVDCPKYNIIRDKHQIPRNIKEALANDKTTTDKIIKFLEETQIILHI